MMDAYNYATVATVVMAVVVMVGAVMRTMLIYGCVSIISVVRIR